MSPITGITHVDAWNANQLVLTEYESVKTMIDEFSGDFTRVFVSEDGDELVTEFVHPENVVYIFGRVGQSPIQYKRPEDLSVKLATKINTGTMWPHQCLVTILHDRLMKNVN